RRRQARGVDERVREIEIVLDERRRAGGERGPVDVAVAEERRQLRLAANHLAGVTGIREEVAVQKRDVGTASLDGAQVIEREDGLVVGGDGGGGGRRTVEERTERGLGVVRGGEREAREVETAERERARQKRARDGERRALRVRGQRRRHRARERGQKRHRRLEVAVRVGILRIEADQRRRARVEQRRGDEEQPEPPPSRLAREHVRAAARQQQPDRVQLARERPDHRERVAGLRARQRLLKS